MSQDVELVSFFVYHPVAIVGRGGWVELDAYLEDLKAAAHAEPAPSPEEQNA